MAWRWAVAAVVVSSALLVLGGAGYALSWLASLCIYTAGIVAGATAMRLVNR